MLVKKQERKPYWVWWVEVEKKAWPSGEPKRYERESEEGGGGHVANFGDLNFFFFFFLGTELVAT